MCSTTVQVLPSGKSSLSSNHPSRNKASSTFKSFISGSVTGTITCILFQPLDLVKTNLQLQPVSAVSTVLHTNAQAAVKPVLTKNGIVNTITDVVQRESFKGLWRGLTPSLYRTVPGIGMYFCTLHWMKSSLISPTLMENMAIGFTARSLVCTLMLPITVVKTRYESGCFGYTSVPCALSTIWRLEGVRGLFSGCTATIARDAPYSGIYYMFYSQQKELLTKAYGRPLNATDNFQCGLIAGVLACIVTQPADVIKTQLQLYPQRYRGVVHCVRTLCREGGVSKLSSGIVPRCARKSLLSALSWTLFEEMMKLSVWFNKL